MASDRTNTTSSTQHPDLEQELLHLILDDQATYPWEPGTEPSSSFFSALEDEWVASQTDEELTAIDAQGSTFFAQLEQAWSPAANSLQAQLVQHFGDRVPQTLLNHIAQQAQTLIKTQQPLANQLVGCVQTVLSGWELEDLMVLARPYAYAMRGSNTNSLEAALRSVRYAAWTELSGVEQARLSLAIARYTLTKLPTDETR